jgi:MFS family permease
MIRIARRAPHAHHAHRHPAPFQPPASVHRGEGYGMPFWLAYAANFLVSVGVAVLVRYGDFITLLGGTEFHLGWIVGIGMIGSLGMRLAMGVGIDRYGPRPIWFGSIFLFVATCLAHLAIVSHTGPAIYLLRVAYCCSLAGIYGASLTFVSGRAPLARMAELIGILGTSGFVGSMVGTSLGDVLRGSGTIERWQLNQMFIAAALLGVAAIPLSWLATRRSSPPPQHASPPALHVLRRYRPGWLLLALVMATGAALNLPSTFLPNYAAELAIPRIGLFFTVYSITAVLTRVLTRRWPQRLGLRTMLLWGTVGLVTSQLLFLLVEREWQLVLPAIAFGMSHAVLFPATVAAGNCRFPQQHRGLGTTLVLATWDVGQLIGMPVAGAIVHYGELKGLPAYPAMFLTFAAVVAVAGVCYALGTTAASPSAASMPQPEEPAADREEPRPRRAKAHKVVGGRR